MSILDVIHVPNIILTQSSEEVDRFDNDLADLVTNLFDTMAAHKGIGLAAPQVGVLKRLFVCHYDSQRLVCVNPEIQFFGDLFESEEGCLSIPNVLSTVQRYPRIVLNAYDVTGQYFTKSYDAMMAIIIQHEFDHLEGLLITDKSLKTRYDFDQSHDKEMS